MLKLIGLCGKKGVGKNCMAELIAKVARSRENLVWAEGGPKQHSLAVELAAYADPIKEFCIKVLGISHQSTYGSDEEKNVATRYEWGQMPAFVREKNPGKVGKMTAREVLQVFGTEFIRDYWGRDVWAEAMARRISASKADLFIITDVRFPNEARLVHDLGGRVWRVSGKQRIEASRKDDSHESENSLDGITPDVVIDNGKDFSDGKNYDLLVAEIRKALG